MRNAINTYFDDTKKCSERDLKQITSEIMQNNSIIIIPPAGDSRFVLPTITTTRETLIDPRFSLQLISQDNNDRSWFFAYYNLHDDQLGNSFKNFLNFVNINGTDIKDINEDTLFDLINKNKTTNNKQFIKTTTKKDV